MFAKILKRKKAKFLLSVIMSVTPNIISTHQGSGLSITPNMKQIHVKPFEP